MSQTIKNYSKTVPGITLAIIIVLVVIAGLMWFFSTETDNNKSKNGTIASQRVIFSVREVTAVSAQGPSQYRTTVYMSTIDGAKKEQIYQTPINAAIQLLSNGSYGVRDIGLDSSVITQINAAGQVEKTYSFREPVHEFVLSPDGTIYAYGSYDIRTTNDGGPLSSIETMTVVKPDGSKKDFIATDFIPNAKKDFQQVVPLAFSEDNTTLFVSVWPTARGGDISDPNGYYAVAIKDWKIKEISFSGSRKLDFKLDDAEPAILTYIPFLKTPRALIATSIEVAKITTISLLDQTTGERKILFTTDGVGQYPDLSVLPTSLSPDEHYLVLSQGFNAGFSLYDLVGNKMMTNFSTDGEPVGWLGNDEVVYRVWRHQAWDDQQYTLKIFNLTTKRSTEVYTQTTDRVEGAGLSEIGDRYYDYVGPVNKQ
jgi:hypothetical protein